MATTPPLNGADVVRSATARPAAARPANARPANARPAAARLQAPGPDGGIVIRDVRPDEFAAAAEVVVAAYLHLSTPEADWYFDVIRDVATRAAAVPVLVAVERSTGAVVGSVTFVPGPGPYAETSDPHEAGFRMLGVAPDAQGRGIGRALVEACIVRARAVGALRLGLLTRDTMVAAQALYEHLGFRRDEAGDVEPVPGIRLHRYVLELSSE